MKVIIIGGVAAGMSAASKLKRLQKDTIIQVYEKGRDLSYSGCGMPYYLGGIIDNEQSLIARYKEDFEKQGISVSLHHEVIKVNPEQNQVSVKNLKTNTTFIDTYDKLIIATGTKALRTNVEGSDQANLYVLNQLEDMRDLEDEITAGKKALVLGGGYIGVEVAENLALKHVDVTLVQRDPQLLNVYDQEFANKAQDVLEAHGIKVYLNEQLLSYSLEDDQTIVHTDKETYHVDFVIEAIGVKPNTDFLQDSGIKMAKNGAIFINDKGETNIKNIYAGGDCVLYHHLLTKEAVFVPLGTHANKIGRIIAEQIAGLNSTFPGILGSNIIKVGHYALGKTGLGIKEAKNHNIDAAYVDITANDRSGYYPGVVKLDVRLVYDKQTQVILGAQLFGEKGVNERINTMALAITKQLTAKDLSLLDFAYAPPFSTVWDPLLVASNQIK